MHFLHKLHMIKMLLDKVLDSHVWLSISILYYYCSSCKNMLHSLLYHLKYYKSCLYLLQQNIFYNLYLCRDNIFYYHKINRPQAVKELLKHMRINSQNSKICNKFHRLLSSMIFHLSNNIMN